MTVRVTPLIDPQHRPPGERLAWLAAAGDGRPLGTAFLWLPLSGGTADVQLHVHPAERRAGIASRLLRQLTEAATARGVRALLTEPVELGSGGDLFCTARGFRPVLTLTYTRLALKDDPRPVPVAVPGYRLVHWEGTVPDSLAETFTRARPAMDDMPMGDATYTPQPWTIGRLHQVAAAVAERGETLCTTAALTSGGEMAAFTELVVPATATGDAQHYGTGVLRPHRGRGLARWMKAEQIALVRRSFPHLDGLLADTADTNLAMRRTNESLGYRVTHRSLLHQRELAA